MMDEGRILEKLDRMHQDIGKIEQHLAKLNGTVTKHETRLSVIEDWRRSIEDWRDGHETAQREIGRQVTDVRVEIAKMAALGGSFGGVIAIVVAILKVVGVL